MIGQRFGRYVVLDTAYHVESKGRSWFCRCDCGIEKYVRRHDLVAGRAKCCTKCSGACGHHRHGLTRTPEYQTVMRHHRYIFRDFHPKYKWYKGMPFDPDWDYRVGGSIWKGAVWILENLGPRPAEGNYSLDIIKHELGFVKGNLRWATRLEQANNRRDSVTPQKRFERISKAAANIGYKLVPL